MQHAEDPNSAPTHNNTRVIAGAVLLVTLVGIALSVSNPLLALEMERWGVSTTIGGLTATLAGLGNVLAVPFVPLLAQRFGVRPVLAACLAIAAATFSAFWLFQGLWLWSALRFLLGSMIGVLFVLSEFWINAAADPAKRGRVMGYYSTALYLGFALGPALLGSIGTHGPQPYLATSMIVGLGIVPLMLVGVATPQVEGHASSGVMRYVRQAPTATFAALVFGIVETGVVTQLPLHGLRLGLSETQATMLLSAFTLGNVVFQLPLGFLSDAMDRRRLLLALAVISALMSAILPLIGAGFWPNAVVLFLLGGMSGALYTVGLAYLGARFGGIDLVSANAAFVMLYSVGLMIGPPLIGLGIDHGGTLGLPLICAVILTAYAFLVRRRLNLRPISQPGA